MRSVDPRTEAVIYETVMGVEIEGEVVSRDERLGYSRAD